MTDERINTAATITSGEAFDGQNFQYWFKKSKVAGATVNEVMYRIFGQDYKLISKNLSIIKGTSFRGRLYL